MSTKKPIDDWTNSHLGRQRRENLIRRIDRVAAHGYRSWRDTDAKPEPPSIKQARATLRAYEQKQKAVSEKLSQSVEKEVQKTRSAVLFSHRADDALKHVQALEALAVRRRWLPKY